MVVPTYNEAANIDPLLDRLLALDANLNVLVVDDGSPDGTGELVRRRAGERVHLHERASKQGLGRAYVAGFRWGLDRGFTHLVEMDADFSHDPAAVLTLLEAAGDCDIAIGSRYVPGGAVEGWSRPRLVLSRAGNLYARMLLGFPVRDSTSGFRCYRRGVLESIDLDGVASEGYAFQIDLTYRAWRRGFSIREVPILFRERERGQSKMSRRIVAEAMRSVTAWGLRDLGRRRPRTGTQTAARP